MSRSLAEPESADILANLIDGRGVADTPGKKVFVDGALQGESVRFRRRRKKRSFDEAELLEVLRPSPERVEPRCAAFGVCGGCSLQHLDSTRQIAMKQSVVRENFERIGQVEVTNWLEPLAAGAWGYRRKARLAVKNVHKKGRVLVGFRERNKPYVADMSRCETLHPDIGEHLGALAELIAGLSIRDRLPQIECAVGDNATAMIFRVLDPPTRKDLDRLVAFAESAGIQAFLQTGGPGTVAPVPGAAEPEPLLYSLPEYRVTLEFRPTDFIQVNAEINSLMIAQALDLLECAPDSHALDLFCGLGNFSLPLARHCADVTAYELSVDMIQLARRNAERNAITNVDFQQADLAKPDETILPADGIDRVLLDPPRTGAAEMIDPLLRLGPRRIVYVSCHPGTLARDAHRLVHEGGYELAAAGVMDMFAQTSHVESMALFVRG